MLIPTAPERNGLHLGLDTALPPTAAAQGDVVYVAGWCFDETAAIQRIELLVDERPQRIVAWRMPRYQVAKEHAATGGKESTAYRSGFWGFAELDAASRWEVGLRVWVSGVPHDAALGAVDAVTSPEQPEKPVHPADDEEPLIAVCMTTFNPDERSFANQIASLRDQTYGNWICVVSDDHSESEAFDMIKRTVRSDTRFVIYRNSVRLGFYLNFEQALKLAPPNAPFIALSDQDDYWHPQKLETLLRLARRPGVTLAYCDMRIVKHTGSVLRQTFWTRGRRNNSTDLGRMLYANSVTGAASVFRRRVLDVALPFPRIRGQFHDHWLACVALALGELAYFSDPLHDYVQHPRNVLGFSARPGPENSGSRVIQQWYFVNVVGAMTFGRELIVRVGDLEAVKLRSAWPVSRLDSLDGAGALLGRLATGPLDRRGIQTLAGLAWRWAMRAAPGGTWRHLSVTKAGYPGLAER